MNGALSVAAGRTLPLLEEGGGAFNPLQYDNWSLFFWQAVVFAVLFVVLLKWAWRPLMAVVDAREKRIREDMERAETARTEAEQVRQEHQRKLEQVAQETRQALDEARERAERLQAELEGKARADAEAIMAKARQEIEAEKRQALDQIKQQVVDLSVEISRRVAARSVGAEDHLREAEALLKRVGGAV